MDHYRQHGSHGSFATFIDFNKAFDNVDNGLLFCNLLDNDPSSNDIWPLDCLHTGTITRTCFSDGKTLLPNLLGFSMVLDKELIIALLFSILYP